MQVQQTSVCSSDVLTVITTPMFDSAAGDGIAPSQQHALCPLLRTAAAATRMQFLQAAL